MVEIQGRELCTSLLFNKLRKMRCQEFFAGVPVSGVFQHGVISDWHFVDKRRTILRKNNSNTVLRRFIKHIMSPEDSADLFPAPKMLCVLQTDTPQLLDPLEMKRCK